MKFLFAVFPATGHVNPGLPIACELARRGHDVRWYSTSKFRNAIEAAGARFVPYKRALEVDESTFGALPDRPKGGLKQLQWDIENVFVGVLPEQFADIAGELHREPADMIVGDTASLVSFLVSEKLGIPFVTFGVTVITFSSRDTAPFGTALMPSSSPIGRLRNRLLHAINDRVIFRAALRRYRRIRRDLGLPRLRGSAFDFPKHAALFLQGTAPSFEYPRSDLPPNVRWIGASIPEPPADWTPPAWWDRMDGRRVVLVTQGTVNNDYDQLIRPAIRALANEDVFVIATTGSKPASAVAIDPLPRNVVVERFVPYAHLMPKVDLLLTNGGYGTVQIALAHGVPVIAVGKTEEKPEVANRVVHSGVGIGLKVLVPAEDDLRRAAFRVLHGPAFRLRAKAIAADMASLHGAAEAARLIESLL
jgi:MGT family glycosyltransferase